LLTMVGRVYQQLDELGDAVECMTRGDDGLLRFGTTGSPGRCLVPIAIAELHRNLPRLTYHVDVLLIDQIIDYLLFHRGECVVSVFPIRHPLVQSKAIGHGSITVHILSRDRLWIRPAFGAE
jgi:DNA-binding transcriptional LysR family regulator